MYKRKHDLCFESKKDDTMDPNTEKIFYKLPDQLKERILQLPRTITDEFEEIRIKSGCDTIVISGNKEYKLRDSKEITPDLLEEILNRLLDYSYYAYEEELSKGYITIEGGHRVGICGKVTLNNGSVHLIKDVSSLNIRRSREIKGAANSIIDHVLGEEAINNTLIVSPPKCGKTTMIRDIARILSSKGFRIGICDERSEIAGCYNGVPGYDLGMRTDVLDGCPKAQGIIMLIRSMSPDVIITDEIGKKEDVKAIEEALCSGVKIITTIHGNSFEDVAYSTMGTLIKNHVFDTLVFLTGAPRTGTVRKVMKLSYSQRG